MVTSKVLEFAFFFGFLALVGYVLWLMFAPFLSALALAAIIVTICYPLYERMMRIMPRNNKTLASLVTTLFVLLVIVLPVLWLSSILVREAVAVYTVVGQQEYSFASSLSELESTVERLIPGITLDSATYISQGAQWLASKLGVIFAGTASTIFLFFISLIASFYFFRDGRAFTRYLLKISPLPDTQDELILGRLAIAVRSVALGTVLVALIQGFLTGIGFALLGFDRAVLLGVVAAFGALIPGVGTSIVFVPAIVYLMITGTYAQGIALMVWAALAVGLIDNLLGPYLMSRGNALHPFLILLSVLGGVTLFGPIGFIVGPVIMSLFSVLVELYAQYLAR